MSYDLGMPIAPPTGCGFHPAPYATHFEKVPVRYRPNAASGGWSYGRDVASLP